MLSLSSFIQGGALCSFFMIFEGWEMNGLILGQVEGVGNCEKSTSTKKKGVTVKWIQCTFEWVPL